MHIYSCQPTLFTIYCAASVASCELDKRRICWYIAEVVSIYDIARKTGLSASTVSRVLNNKSCSPEASEKVMRAASEMDYVPDARASSLKAGVNKCIGVIIPDIANPIYPPAVKTIHDLAKEKGYYMALGNTYGKMDEEMEILRRMAKERVGGIIIATSEGEDDRLCNPYISSMMISGTKVVLAGRIRHGLQADFITVDNTEGAYKATSYLVRIGRRRIGFMSGPRDVGGSEGRREGYLNALKESGINADESIMSFLGWDRASGYNQMRSMLDQRLELDAIFCCNDLLAIGAIEALKERNISVPGDIAIVGFDDIELSSLVTPKLTTVVQPQVKLATMACNLLMDRMENRISGPPVEVVVKPEFVIRESA
jgi:LacI family transcriptional regulator